jgi:predicted lipid carrier protein YhbT
MASVKQCRASLNRLAALLATVDPELRRKHLPNRTVVCHVKDLGVSFTARLDQDGLHDIAQVAATASPHAEVTVTVDSGDLVALAAGKQDVMTAWLHGRVQVSAPMRDMLRLRSILGL